MSITAYAKEGGPGDGDIFVYYKNAKLIWRSENKKLYVSLLGADPIEQVSAAQLKRGLLRLRNKPKETKDDSLQLDVNSISQLLKLDPFTNIKGHATLSDDKRFQTLDSWHIKAGSNRQTFRYTLKSDDLQKSTSIITNVESDKEGALSQFGLGVTDNKTIQAKITQSNSQQYSTTEEYSQDFTFYGNSPGNDYTVRIYFDVVFSSFAFQLIKNNGKHTITDKRITN